MDRAVPMITEYLAGMRPDNLPQDVVETTQKFILDSIGVAAAGWRAPGCAEVIGLLKEWGGKPEATVMGWDGKVPAPWAALANSMMMHALDFDDTLDDSALHAHVSVLPAALACAEALGGIPGLRLIAAVALGVDIVCRLGLATVRPLSWIRTATCGTFGAAAAAGYVLGLDREGFQRALSIAYSQTAGNAQCLVDGGLVKRMQPAFSAKAGVLAAFLASRNVTGSSDFLEGRYGFFNLYEGGDYRRELLTQGLGREFFGMQLSIKPYPSCRMTHASIDAVLSLRRQHRIDPQGVDQIVVKVSPMSHSMVGAPFAIRANPQVDAQFSIPYTVATAMLKGDVSPEDFEEDAVRDALVGDYSRKVTVIADPALPERDMSHASMEIRAGENVFSTGVEAMKGSPANPMTMDECAAKFRKCVAYGANAAVSAKAAKIEAALRDLPSLRDIRHLMDLFA